MPIPLSRFSFIAAERILVILRCLGCEFGLIFPDRFPEPLVFQVVGVMGYLKKERLARLSLCFHELHAFAAQAENELRVLRFF